VGGGAGAGSFLLRHRAARRHRDAAEQSASVGGREIPLIQEGDLAAIKGHAGDRGVRARKESDETKEEPVRTKIAWEMVSALASGFLTTGLPNFTGFMWPSIGAGPVGTGRLGRRLRRAGLEEVARSGTRSEPMARGRAVGSWSWEGLHRNGAAGSGRRGDPESPAPDERKISGCWRGNRRGWAKNELRAGDRVLFLYCNTKAEPLGDSAVLTRSTERAAMGSGRGKSAAIRQAGVFRGLRLEARFLRLKGKTQSGASGADRFARSLGGLPGPVSIDGKAIKSCTTAAGGEGPLVIAARGGRKQATHLLLSGGMRRQRKPLQRALLP